MVLTLARTKGIDESYTCDYVYRPSDCEPMHTGARWETVAVPVDEGGLGLMVVRRSVPVQQSEQVRRAGENEAPSGCRSPKVVGMLVYNGASARLHARRMAAMTAVPPVHGEGRLFRQQSPHGSGVVASFPCVFPEQLERRIGQDRTG